MSRGEGLYNGSQDEGVPMSLSLHTLFDVAKRFAIEQSGVSHVDLIGVTDGKAVGTYVEHQFENRLRESFPDIEIGNSARGIDIPDPRVTCDLKVTSARQPQSSCPYEDARQKIYGLGYNLLVFVYEKNDTDVSCQLDFQHVALIEKERTADFTLTRLINQMLDADASVEDIAALFADKALPGDEITLAGLAEEVVASRPKQGYLTISNALQWRLQYSRIITLDNKVEGVANYDR